jgi:Heat induced stress protein YflT domain
VKTVVGMFETTSDVDAAITELTKAGFDKRDISVVARREVLKESGLDTMTGAEVGAITGATTGGIAGLLIGLGALVIPGIGPIVAAGEFLTWIGAMVLGLAAGAIGGGLLGGLVALGLPEHEAKVYVEGVKRGNLIVAVRAPEERIAQAEEIFRAGNAVDINSRRQEWEEDIVPLNTTASSDVEYPATPQ